MAVTKKTNKRPSLPGGVQKSTDVRVNAKMLPAPVPAEIVPKRISKLKNAKKMRTIVGDSSEEIQQLLENNETDQAVSLMYKRMLQTLVDLLPYAEKAIRDSKGAKGIYGINSLVSSIRELMVDIQSAQDRGMLAESLLDRVVQPAFRELGTDFVKEFAVIENDTKAIMLSKEPMQKEDVKEFRQGLYAARQRLADSMQRQYQHMADEIKSFLQR